MRQRRVHAKLCARHAPLSMQRDAAAEFKTVHLEHAQRASSLTIEPVPLTIFDIKGVPGHRRERIEAAVVAGSKHASLSYEGWISADPFKGGFRLLITGPHGFERNVTFAIDDDPAVIADRVRETLED